MTLVDDRHLYKILYQTDFTAGQGLFQQRQILLLGKGRAVFVDRGLQIACLFVGLPQVGTPLRPFILPLEVDACGLRFGYLYLASILEQRERETYYYTIQRMSLFVIPSVSHLQAWQPSLPAGDNLFAGSIALSLQR